MSNHLREVTEVYFQGLRDGDVSAVPYAEDVEFRTPLAAGGSESPIIGRTAVLNFFNAIYAAIDDVDIHDRFFNQDNSSICVRADIKLKSGKVLRVADIFTVSPDGMVIAQENHYDPSPAA